MAMSTLNVRASAVSRPTSSRTIARTAAPRAAVARTWQSRQVVLPGRGSLKMFSSDTGAENDDQLVSDKGEILQGKQEKETMTGGGMGSEEKRAEMPAQGGAPEGDRAAAGEETQLTGEPSSGAQPDSGDKMADAGKDASQTASEEAGQQEDRAPLQD